MNIWNMNVFRKICKFTEEYVRFKKNIYVFRKMLKFKQNKG